MTSLEAYQSLLDKVNRGDTSANIHVPRGRFVSVYNQQALKWLARTLEKARASQALDELSDLLVDDHTLLLKERRSDHVRFQLPQDFFEFSSAWCLASRGVCHNRPLVVWEMKSSDKRVLLGDDNHRPSFDYEETLGLIQAGHLNVYTTDFTVEEAALTYYRKPRKIDLEGYTRLDGSRSQTIDPDIDEDLVEDILEWCAAEIMRSNQNAEGLQFSKDRQS